MTVSQFGRPPAYVRARVLRAAPIKLRDMAFDVADYGERPIALEIVSVALLLEAQADTLNPPPPNIDPDYAVSG